MASSLVLLHPWTTQHRLPSGAVLPKWAHPLTPFGLTIPELPKIKARVRTELLKLNEQPNTPDRVRARHDLEAVLYLTTITAVGLAVTQRGDVLRCEIIFTQDPIQAGTHLSGVVIDTQDTQTPISVTWPSIPGGVIENQELRLATQDQER